MKSAFKEKEGKRINYELGPKDYFGRLGSGNIPPTQATWYVNLLRQ